MNYHFKKMPTPLGNLTLVASSTHLIAVLWPGEAAERLKLPTSTLDPHHPILVLATLQIEEYLAGQRKSFQLPLQFVGTEFQIKVWRQLQAIPYGKTRCYSELAEKIGSPRSCRAVGAANGRNPLPMIVPCHRVIGRNGKLTGFAGGLSAKSFLLNLEKGSSNTG